MMPTCAPMMRIRLLTENKTKWDQYFQIFKYLGFNRMPSRAEQKLIDGWFDTYGFDMEIIQKGVGLPRWPIDKPSIKYVDSVLKDWFESGEIKEKPKKTSVRKKSKHKLSNTHEYDFEELEKRWLNKTEKLMKKLIEETQKRICFAPRTGDISSSAPQKRKVFANIDGLSEIEEKIAQLGIVSLQSLHDKEDNRIKIFEEIDALKKKKQRLLKEAGYSEEEFLPDFQCKCNDSGWWTEKAVFVLNSKWRQALWHDITVICFWKKKNFDTFNFELYSNKARKAKNPRQNIKQISAECLQYTVDFGRHSGNLIFTGAPGVGKTFMINCIVAELLQKGVYVVYMTAYDLIDLLRKASSVTMRKPLMLLLSKLYNCDLLAIDDLGTENATDFAIDF